jgi:hypothetical protein
LITAGVPTRATASQSSSSVAARANAAVGMPRSARNVFSLARSCAVCNATPDGRTGVSASMASTASIGTFSNSKVTTSTPPANVRSASRSS